MNVNRNIFEKSYYKVRIIITFSVMTIIIVVIISWVSFNYTKNLYLNQLNEQVNVVVKMLSRQIDEKYLALLSFGSPTKATEGYFRELFTRNKNPKLHSEIFIFDKNFDIVVHSDSNIAPGTFEPRLLINQKDILDLNIKSAAVSIPFKGNDNKWYMWGFYRLEPNYWLAVRESAARLEKVEELSSLFLYFGLSGIALSILLALLISGSITKPLDKLVRFSAEIGKGNFDSDLPKAMHGEIGTLAYSMDKMKKDLAANQKEKEKLLAQIAHEIRNPLGGIELLAYLTKEDLIKENKNTDYLDKILKELSHLKSLISSYLNFSRPMPADPSWISVSKIISEVEEIVRTQCERKNIKFKVNSGIDKVWFDENHLRQILVNLVSNSLDSTFEGGEINIKASVNSKYWKIEVEDNGTGIPESEMNFIFNPFFTTKKDGTGLGLSIIKKLCKENKAEISVNNNPERGSTFIIKKEIINEF